MLAVDPSLFAAISGSTDSEVLFHLALTFGLEDDPIAALEQAIGLVEETARAKGIENPVQASIGVMDGERLWAVRYSTERHSRTLFASADASAIRALHPDNPQLQRLREEDRLVVSEPLADLPGVWDDPPVRPARDARPVLSARDRQSGSRRTSRSSRPRDWTRSRIPRSSAWSRTGPCRTVSTRSRSLSSMSNRSRAGSLRRPRIRNS
jgi:hypothetical protein